MTGTENTGAGTPERNAGELTGAYALNALDARERAAFEAHLESSEEARIEAAELSDTAVALGLATAPVQPSAALKASLMAKLASTPQLAPRAEAVNVPAADAAPAAPRLAAVPPVPPPGTPAPSTAAEPAPAAGSGSGSGASAAERARKRWFQRPASLLLAAAAAAALFVGGTFFGQGIAGTSDSFVAQQAASFAQLNAAPDVQRASATTADGHQATLVWSDTSSLSALVVDGLPALSGDKDYQLWYIGAGGAVSAGLLDTSVSASGGTAWRVLDGSLTAGDTIGLTVEPKGGSTQPTTTPVLAIQSS